VYLLHWPLLLVSDRVRVRLHVHGVGSDVWFCGYFAVVLALSVVTYYGIERPARRWLKEGSSSFLKKRTKKLLPLESATA
jgi:peptidoglycan/LPS O-acetylase OafA/YrhL